MLPLLELLSDSELDSKDSALVIEHLNGCCDCQHEWRQVEQLRAIFKLARENTIAPATLIEKIDKAVSLEKKVQRQFLSGGKISFIALLGVAATVLLLGFTASLVLPNLKTDRKISTTLTTSLLVENSSNPNQFEPISDLDRLAQRIGYQLKYVHLPDWKMQTAGLAKTSSSVGIARFSFVRNVNGTEQTLCCYQGPERSIRCTAQNCKQEKVAEKLVAFGIQGTLSFALWSQNGRDYLFVTDMPQTELKKVVEGA